MDYQFVHNLILVIVPTMIGVVGSNVLINSWQMRKEKFSLRKEIISSFNDGFVKENLLMHQLFVRICEEYTVIPRNAEMTDSTIIAKWNFPDKEEEQPLAMFSNLYKKLVIEYSNLTHKSNYFDSMLDLYFTNTKKIDPVITSLINSFEKTTNELKRMIYSQNLDKLMNSTPILIEHFDENFLLINKLNRLLINEKLRNPQESIWNFSFSK